MQQELPRQRPSSPVPIPRLTPTLAHPAIMSHASRATPSQNLHVHRNGKLSQTTGGDVDVATAYRQGALVSGERDDGQAAKTVAAEGLTWCLVLADALVMTKDL